MDIDSIPLGIDFREHINKTLRATDILIVLIGDRWLGPRFLGRARIKDIDDPVRVEIETALALKIRIIPVLTGGASMPQAKELPNSIQALSFRNAAPCDPGRDFNTHVERLIRATDEIWNLGQDANAVLGAASELPPTSNVARRIRQTRSVATYLAYLMGGAVVCATALATYYFFYLPKPDSTTVAAAPRSTAPAQDIATPTSPAAPLVSAEVPRAEDACADIKAVLPYTGNFDAIRLATKTSDGWNTTKKVSGYASCYITYLLQDTFVCESSPLELSAAKELFNSNQEKIKSCLGDGWIPLPMAGDISSLRNVQSGQLVSVSVIAAERTFVNLTIFEREKPKPVASRTLIKSITAPIGFCADLKRVVKEAKTNFRSILGRERGYASWTARVQLSGFDDCDISDVTDRYYSCTVGPFVSLADANTGENQEEGYIKECLGNDWVRDRRQSADLSNQATFEGGAKDPTVEVRLHYNNLSQYWQLLVEVTVGK